MDYQTPGTPTLFQLGISQGGNDKLELEYNFSVTANNGNLESHVIRQPGRNWTQTYGYEKLETVDAILRGDPNADLKRELTTRKETEVYREGVKVGGEVLGVLSKVGSAPGSPGVSVSGSADRALGKSMEQALGVGHKEQRRP